LEEKLGMGEQGSMMIMSDVSDRAEERRHFNIMRMYKSHHGKLSYKERPERQAEQIAEMKKMREQVVLQEVNRLGMYDEVPDADYEVTGKRKSYITDVGLTYYRENYHSIKNRVQRNEFNPNQAMNAAQPHNRRRIFEAAKLITDVHEQREYLQTMSALIEYGYTKLSGQEGKTVFDEVYEGMAAVDATRGRKWPPSPGTKINNYGVNPATDPDYIKPADRTEFYNKKQ